MALPISAAPLFLLHSCMHYCIPNRTTTCKKYKYLPGCFEIYSSVLLPGGRQNLVSTDTYYVNYFHVFSQEPKVIHAWTWKMEVPRVRIIPKWSKKLQVISTSIVSSTIQQQHQTRSTKLTIVRLKKANTSTSHNIHLTFHSQHNMMFNRLIVSARK